MPTFDALFKGASKTSVPWSQAGRLKGEDLLPVAVAERLVREPPRLVEVDPTVLRSTQPWVLASHVHYYLSGEWEWSGRTSADMDQTLNRYPLILDRRGQLVILTGHHRSTAALIEGRPVMARMVVGSADGPVVVTPHLMVDASTSTHEPIGELAARLRSGRPVTVGSAGDAAKVLRGGGLSDDEVDDRLRISRLSADGSRPGGERSEQPAG